MGVTLELSEPFIAQALPRRAPPSAHPAELDQTGVKGTCAAYEFEPQLMALTAATSEGGQSATGVGSKKLGDR